MHNNDTDVKSSSRLFSENVDKMTKYLLRMRRSQNKADAEFLASLGNLNMQQLGTLNIVGDNQPCSMTVISITSALSLSSTTLVIDKLVRKKLALRKRCEKDRRVIYVSLTPEGQKVYDAQVDHMKMTNSIVLATLSEQEQRILLQFMQRFSAL